MSLSLDVRTWPERTYPWYIGLTDDSLISLVEIVDDFVWDGLVELCRSHQATIAINRLVFMQRGSRSHTIWDILESASHSPWCRVTSQS
jgi:hypothetical protein